MQFVLSTRVQLTMQEFLASVRCKTLACREGVHACVSFCVTLLSYGRRFHIPKKVSFILVSFIVTLLQNSTASIITTLCRPAGSCAPDFSPRKQLCRLRQSSPAANGLDLGVGFGMISRSGFGA